MREVIATARGRFDTLRLSTDNHGAARLYEAMGFRPGAGVANGTHVTGLRAG